MRIRIAIAALTLTALAAAQDAPPRHEVGLTLGRLLSAEREGSGTRLDLGTGTALQVNYGYRIAGSRTAAVYGELHFLASPQRLVTSTDRSLTRDVATIFLTPGIRVKLLPGQSVSPWVAVGAGLSIYEQSTSTLAGTPNSAPRVVNHGAFNFGGGVDFKFWKFIGLRAEIRDFYAGGPSYNTRAIRGGQHNVVAGGGLVLRFR